MTPRRLLLAGALGSSLVAAGGWGSGALPVGTGSRSWGVPLFVVGLLLLSAAWCRLRSHAGLAAVLWGAPLLLAPPLASRDAYAYLGQAALVVEGLDPYAVGPAALPGPLAAEVDDVWRDVPSPYGPLWLVLASLVVRVTGDSVVAGLAGVRLLAVLGLLLAGWALHRLGRERALWLGVANPLVLLHLVGGMHNEALMLGLLLAGLAVRPLWLAAVLVTLGALVKLPVLVALLPLVLARWRASVAGPAHADRTADEGVALRSAADQTAAVSTDGASLRSRPALSGLVGPAVVAGSAALATGVGVTLLSGLGLGWVTALDAGTARLSLFSPMTGLGVLLPGGDAVRDAALVGGLVVGLLIGLVLLLRVRGPVAATGWALLAVALLLPVVQPWYLLWGLLPLAAVVRDRPARALAAGTVVLCLLVQPSGRSVVRPPLYGVPTLLALAAAAVVLRTSQPVPQPVRDTPRGAV